MKREKLKYYQALFTRLNASWDFRKEVSAFGRFFHDPVWVMVSLVCQSKMEITKQRLLAHIREQAYGHKIGVRDKNKIFAVVKSARRKKTLEVFAYGDNYHGLCYPLKVEGDVFGFILLVGIKGGISANMRAIFQSFSDTIVRETQKEIELAELNETIRPRAIALSTVHTVHRLMSSSLSLNELLSRIARLALQVIKANRCSIKLLDKKGKTLLPKTTVDLRRKKAKLKKVEIGKYAPGKAVKKARTIRGKSYLATPLIEEDVVGVITLYDKLDNTPFTAYDEGIMRTMAEQAVIAIKNSLLFREQESLTMSSIRCIAMLLKARPAGGGSAAASFLKLISIIGRKFQMNESEIKMIQYAAMLHDAGQMSIPDKVLMKKGGLTGEELDIVKTHPRKGANILSKSKHLKPIVPIILYHHENYNGTGYPKGLKKEEIPLSARVMAVASAFEAMILEKPYRKALSISAAVEEVKKNSGVQFDPKVVDAFCLAAKRKDVLKLLKKEFKRKNKRPGKP
ncbi:MAG: HD domain-containing protein [Candidatus Omnitrophica bacterium]|nr:HD domain-containing protein [Candidatus Omnitrophota bacterium]